MICDDQTESRRRRARRQGEDDLEQRAARAEMLVHFWGVTPARQALDGAAVAPGNQATLNSVTDNSRRLAQPRDPLPERLLNSVPEVKFQLVGSILPTSLLLEEGAAGGPLGMTKTFATPFFT